MPESRIVKWAGSTNSPNARDYYAVIERRGSAEASTARSAFLRSMLRESGAVPFMECRHREASADSAP